MFDAIELECLILEVHFGQPARAIFLFSAMLGRNYWEKSLIRSCSKTRFKTMDAVYMISFCQDGMREKYRNMSRFTIQYNCVIFPVQIILSL